MKRMDRQERDRAWRALREDLAGMGSVPAPGNGHDRMVVREAAGAVAAFCLDTWGESPLPTEYLVLLLARCLRDMGEEKAADRLLSVHCRKGLAVCCHASADNAYALSRLWRLEASGIVRASSAWRTDPGSGPCWILDLRVPGASENVLYEMGLWFELRGLLSAAAPVWDATSGEGWLGLRGLRKRAAAATGRRGKNTAPGLVEDCRGRCAGYLDQLARQRGWTHCPRILSLDL